MGKLASCSAALTRHLEPETLVGRGAQCTLRLAAEYASSQHAILRWSGDIWQLWDLDSRNGTWLDGHRVESRRPYPLALGSRLCFGRPEEAWEVTCATEPLIMAVNVVSGTQIVVDGTVQGIPSDDAPEATLYKNKAGLWVVETPESAPTALQNGVTFDAGSQVWRFCYPAAATKTVTSDLPRPPEWLSLHFLVSSDEEYIELRLESSDGCVQLGNRVQNHLLLTLARARLQDRASGVAETSCGWLYKEDLVAGAEGSQRVDHDVFRIRKHIATCAPAIADSIIERRPRTRQLRIGIGALAVTRG